MPPPALMDDLVEEVLLRFPPGEPERFVRAALVCKRWCRLVSDPAFRRRFRELHRNPPMLGFVCTRGETSRFVPTSTVPLPHAIAADWRAVDASHARVLLNTSDIDEAFHCSGDDLVAWDPVTDEQRELPKLPENVFPVFSSRWTAAVLCAAGGGCDHLDCHRGGSFLMVFVCTGARSTLTCVYSSETGGWSVPTSVPLGHVSVCSVGSVLVGNALHFVSGDGQKRNKILKYGLSTQETSLIRLPRTRYRNIALMATVDDGLGFAAVHESKLYLWSREAGPKGYARWTQSRAIELETMLWPVGTLPDLLDVVCFVDGVAAIFTGTDGVFTIDLKSCRIRKICEGWGTHLIVPYMSFYTPASTGAGPRGGDSSA